ncbi:exonuclease SbcCD subunit D [Paenibacillus mucilaginosus]|uniref:Nuclease SbcCD subunit D n=2 Tax=Paenibacillus mucilaginosus TaxID=61624 RepID=H6NIF9_9BACL|nr:exonuclease SbcCD subunit D [Paenibacillus mucilaginosus]AEI42664.1 SbcD [Paenibacillus mucilaginosus KNP414]AFC32270.1 SbcD [Paenibacillus mucilaginosus 3016]MCG7217086.1 exonuclease SbcCD subunit D [Paenibacillus mucilaginosus]WDM26054.1 exonuclease SbcCD subunit D [Paenibacillus mucilaginosus]WFA20771.1 exonuclease SbcCD subunit D [Paenibacillus mucilaginosus]
MRILHTADWHFGRTLEGRSRLPEQEAFVDELVELVRDQNIDLVLLAGDVYDSVNPPAAAESLFYDALSRLSDQGRRPVYVIAGNHDHPDRLAAAAPLADRLGVTLVGLPEARVHETHIARTGESAVIYMLPYPSESRLKELLSDEAEETVLRAAYSERVRHIAEEQAKRFRPDTVNLLMSHLYVLGGKETESERPIQVGGAYTVDTQSLSVGAQYVALGHLHRPQNIKAGSLMRYSGSPLAYSFSEAGQAKSVTVLDIRPGAEPQMEEMFLSSGRPLVHWKAKGGLSEVHQWLEEGKDPTAWIDLEVHLTETMSLEQIHKLRQTREGFIHIRPVYPEMEAVLQSEAVSATKAPMDELFRRFYERQTGGAQPEPELVKLFLELLAEEEDDAAV